MRRPSLKRILSALLLFCLVDLIPPFVEAVTLVPVNLEYMTHEADRIFLAHVDKVEARYDENGLWSQFVTFRVVETYKGDLDDSLTIKQVNLTSPPDQESGQTQNILAGVMPEYHVGEDVVVFLSPDSAFGFTSSIGLFQGTFQLMSDESGETIVVNQAQNEGLLNDVTEISSLDSGTSPGLSSARFQALRERPAALKLQNMKDLIKGFLSE